REPTHRVSLPATYDNNPFFNGLSDRFGTAHPAAQAASLWHGGHSPPAETCRLWRQTHDSRWRTGPVDLNLLLQTLCGIAAGFPGRTLVMIGLRREHGHWLDVEASA
ncbi:hypothetical protein ACFOZ4_36380, partial [Hamadaea flava]